jgi:hypothetical protein
MDAAEYGPTIAIASPTQQNVCNAAQPCSTVGDVFTRVRIRLASIAILPTIAAPLVVWTMHHRAGPSHARCVLVHVEPMEYDVLVKYKHPVDVAPVTFETKGDALGFASDLSEALLSVGWVKLED